MENSGMDSLKKAIEAVLFLAKAPLAIKDLKKIVEGDETAIEAALKELMLEYETGGLQIVNLAGGYQIATRPEVSRYVDKFLKPAVEVHLTTPALETLAIIAYRQPISRYQIEHIRGVDCDSVVRTLIDKKLVTESGRADLPGRPILYGTTEQFLLNFGLGSLNDLPPPNVTEPERKISDFALFYQKPAAQAAEQVAPIPAADVNPETVSVPVN